MNLKFNKALANISNQHSIMSACTVTWQVIHRDGRGGGEDYATAQSLPVLQEGLAKGIARIDPYRSPAIVLQPHQLPDGQWRASIRWFGLD